MLIYSIFKNILYYRIDGGKYSYDIMKNSIYNQYI